MRHDQFQLHADVEDRHWWFVARRRILARLVAEVLPPAPDTTVIDVGCGTGANIAALADGYRCLGIDTSNEAIELARARFSNSGVEFRAGLAPRDLGDVISDARLIMLTDVLEHIADDYKMFSELFAAAPPGCIFLITVPADESLWSEHDESFGHYRRYDLARLEGVWDGLPATTLMASYFNTRLLPIVRLVRVSSRRRGHASGLAGTDFRVPTSPLNTILTNIFAGEADRLTAVLHGKKSAYPAGVSLIALLRREPGAAAVRTKPGGLPPDRR